MLINLEAQAVTAADMVQEHGILILSLVDPLVDQCSSRILEAAASRLGIPEARHLTGKMSPSHPINNDTGPLRGGKGEKVFPGPVTFGGPAVAQKY